MTSTLTSTLPTGLELPDGWDRGAPDAPRYVAVAGSWAYGLNHAGSDVDLRGFHMCDPEALLGLAGAPATWASTDPDVVLHEAGKFCTLALAGNPTVLEALAAQWVVETTGFAQDLRDNLDAFLSEKVRDTHIGYARRQFKAVGRRRDGTFSSDTAKRTAKHLRHLFRIIEQGERLLRTGELRIRVEDPAALRRYEQLPLDDAMAYAAAELDRLEDVPCVLPPEPDRVRIDTLLRDHRLAQLGGRR